MPEIERSPKDALASITGLITRRRWYILSAAIVTILSTIGALYKLPNRYTSEATLFVVQQQVPLRYVTPTSTTELADVLPAMTEEALSRNRLLDLVEQFDLYAPQRHHLAPEEVVGLMRQYITIDRLPAQPGNKENAFKISFTASKAILAQEVTSKLTSLFIQENLRTREDQAQTTTAFLRSQVEIARQKLEQQEDLLRDFKTKYLGELPEQEQGNLAILSGAQGQLQTISTSMDRAQQQRVYLQSMLDGYRRLLARANAVSDTPAGAAPGLAAPRPVTPYQTAQAELARAQSERARLLVTYSPKYPDVVAIDREIEVRQELVSSLKPQVNDLTEPAHTDSSQVPQVVAKTQTRAPHESEEDSSIAQIKSQLESNSVEIANLTKYEAQQRVIVAQYQSRLNLTPVREQQLASILRDHELSKQDYADLLGKKQQSELAMTLEKQQGGQQFRVVEPPSLPNLPSSPKRLKMSLAGVGAGLALGLVAAFLIEMKNPAFYTEKEVSLRFSVPLVVGLPLLVSPRDTQRRAWIRVFEWCSGVILIAVVLVAEAWVYRHP